MLQGWDLGTRGGDLGVAGAASVEGGAGGS